MAPTTKKSGSMGDAEQVRLLGQMASAEKSTHASMNKSADILKVVPEWAKCEGEGRIPADSSRVLRQLHSAKLTEQGQIIAENPAVTLTLFKVLSFTDNAHPVQYALTLFYEIVRNDCNKYDDIADALKGEKSVFETFFNLMDDKEKYTADKAAFLLSGLIARSPSLTYSNEQIAAVVAKAIKSPCNLTEFGQLDTLCNILKLDEQRDTVIASPNFIDFLKHHLAPSRLSSAHHTPCLYKAAFCVWCLSFNKEKVKWLLANDLISSLCALLNECRTEKVVRVCIHTLKNALDNDEAVELMIEQKSVQTLTLLEYEKWRDSEMYDEIREGLHHLHMKINLFSNFARYKLELDKQKLKWSFLHSEKFWHENVMQFEDSEFEAVKKLSKLLRSDDVETVCVACHDLGEFARLHPAGKQICQKLQLKGYIMMLMQSTTREIGREALLACQKLMLQRWQEVGKPTSG
eukprot:GHVN01045204.1.p1 GENE.GHVN01045204.1~~GHVN01045204.1.p1  ORF type:complete len:462 (+),score=79.97 GHVN01045204.1:78-1463(+)